MVRLRVAVLLRETADQESQQVRLRRGKHTCRRAARPKKRMDKKKEYGTLSHSSHTQEEESKKERQAVQRRFDERSAWQVG